MTFIGQGTKSSDISVSTMKPKNSQNVFVEQVCSDP